MIEQHPDPRGGFRIFVHRNPHLQFEADHRLRGRRGTFYGITLLYRKDAKPFHEDLPKILALVARRQIHPVIAATFPLKDAKRAIELLATGTAQGKIVLTCD
jgi:NADPH:quinone reductase-like Zn-dependent oxidoreductase